MARALNWAAASLLIAILILATMAVFSVGKHQSGEHPHEADKTSQQQCEQHLDFFDRTIDDPISIFTFLLVAIGGGQVALFWWQLGLIRDGMEDTRIAANAASNGSAAMIEANNISRNNLAASQRAWVKLKANILSGLTFDQDGTLNISFLVETKNIGKSPATSVMVHLHLFHWAVGKGVEEISAQQNKLSVDTRQFGARDILTNIIFPDDFITSSYGFTFAKAELDEITKESDFMKFCLIGCVDYRFPLAVDHHQTWFCYDLVWINNDGLQLIPLRSAGNVPKERLLLKQNFFGRQYAN